MQQLTHQFYFYPAAQKEKDSSPNVSDDIQIPLSSITINTFENQPIGSGGFNVNITQSKPIVQDIAVDTAGDEIHPLVEQIDSRTQRNMQEM